jgi:hypothetical protein
MLPSNTFRYGTTGLPRVQGGFSIPSRGQILIHKSSGMCHIVDRVGWDVAMALFLQNQAYGIFTPLSYFGIGSKSKQKRLAQITSF